MWVDEKIDNMHEWIEEKGIMAKKKSFRFDLNDEIFIDVRGVLFGGICLR
jgi:hypothetical protein